MPGIIPMKVITVGNTSQSRVAQACDRCRSKKIRCDGIRPCCSQCATVGFECRTSDKLSRRAFPRGYTESLEERVRALESEVRTLKDSLDEKDDIIDLLERLRSQSPASSHHRALHSGMSNSSSTPISPRTIAPNGPQPQQQPTPTSLHQVQSQTDRCQGNNKLISPTVKPEPRSSDESLDGKRMPKQLKASRKRFHSPFSEYPRVDSDVEAQNRQQSAKARRSTAPVSAANPPPTSSPHHQHHQQPEPQPKLRKPATLPNLDYFPLGGTDTFPSSPTVHVPSHVSPSEWEHLICSVDTNGTGQAGLYSNLEVGWMPNGDGATRRPTATNSVLSSLSEESFTSGGEEHGALPGAAGTVAGAEVVPPFGGYVNALTSSDAAFAGMSGLEGDFGL